MSTIKQDVVKPRFSQQSESIGALPISNQTRDQLLQEKEFLRTSPAFINDVVQDSYAESSLLDVLTPEEANEEYGIEGSLSFKEPVSRELAQRKYQRMRKGQLIDGFLQQAQQQDTSLLRGIRDFGNALGVQAFDPVNYIPATRALKLHKYSKALSGARGFLAQRTTSGVIDGAIGNLAVTPFAAMQYKKYGMQYDVADAINEVMMGGFIGGGFGAISGIAGSRALGKMRSQARHRKGLHRQYEALRNQVSPETRSHLDDIVSIAEREGRPITNDEMISVAKVFDEQSAYKESNSGNVYTGQTLLRTDPRFLSADEKALLLREVSNSNFFTSRNIGLDEVFVTKRKLPKHLEILKSKLGSLEGTVTLKNLLDGTGTKIKDLEPTLREFGIKAEGKALLNAEQAFEINDVIRGALDEQSVKFEKIAEYQQRLLNSESINELPFEQFKKEISNLIDEFKDSDLNIKNLDELPVDKQIRALKLLRALSEGNLTKKQLADLFSKTELGIRDLYDNALMNRTIKDTIPLDKALDNVKRSAQGEGFNAPEQSLLGEEFDVSIETGASESYLVERSRVLEERLPESQVKEIKEILAAENPVDSSLKLADGMEALLKCRQA